jgi:fructose-1,6-bisphosphatase/inositol monophosphatase family enzyme
MIDVPSVMLQQLGQLLRETSQRELLPRFRNLSAADVIGKPSLEDPHDVVTVADRSAEVFLSERLAELLPGSLVIGEEAVAADESVLSRLRGRSPVWLVDPLDGTRNFAAGEGPFGPMVALVEQGEILLAGIHLSLTDELLVAERRLGAYANGQRLLPSPHQGPLRGTVFDKFMPAELAEDLTARTHGHIREPAVLCAASEYTKLARGSKHYSVYYRLMPWDHAPGALILREAGGVSRHPSGKDYTVDDRRELTIAASSAAAWQQVQGDLFGPS